jgi:hypothetical protein
MFKKNNDYFHIERLQASQGNTHCGVKATGPCVDRKATLVSLNPKCCGAIDLILNKYIKTTRKGIRDIDACFIILCDTRTQHFFALR